MSKLIFNCDKVLNDGEIVFEMLNLSIYSLQDYLEMDGIKKS